MLKKVIKFGDKAICALVIIWVIWQSIAALTAIQSDHKVFREVNKSKEAALRSSPSPVMDNAPNNIHEKIKQDSQWNFEAATRRPSLSYLAQKVDFNALQKEYDAKLANHVCEMVDMAGTGGKVCLFPGCSKQTIQPDVSIGTPGPLKCLDVSAMTVELSWEGVSDLKDATPLYCILQRGVISSGNNSIAWITLLDSDGSPKKIIGRSAGELSEQVNTTSPTTLPSGFQLPVGVVVSAETTTIAKTVLEKIEEKPTYRFLDYNLEPNTKYSYRAKAVGASKRDNSIVEGNSWTEVLEVKTKEDQGVGFVRFLPGLRNKEGQLVKKADGSMVSPDKVYVRVTKLFTPPWSPVRYFINYEHRNISIGQEGQDTVGRMVNNYAIVSSDGSPVYIDSKKEKFLFVSPTLTLDALKQQVDLNKDNWKPYLMEVNFKTSWKALRVDEEIVGDKIMKTKYNAKGQVENVEESIKKYRYFLILENLETKSNLRLELEREDLTKRLLSY